ncbi:MAG: heme NO-binding domain-containing protein [Euryarchaeota archaeon]|nr:heme NO-binding domain-containing protein [Euryarchaeota archaeon]
MHGLIFSELKKYVVARLGGEAWNKLEAEAGLANKIYLPNQVYADEELGRLVGAAVRYHQQINPTWKALDLIEKTEEMIHRVVRLKIPGAQPPHLNVTRTSPKKLMMMYSSPRRMCGVAIGLARGVGKQYKEPLKVSEQACMNKGATACAISIENA